MTSLAESPRALGARGSRRAVASADPAAELTPTAAAVVAAIPAWWTHKARFAGLDGEWLDVEQAIDALPPCPVPKDPPLEDTWGELTGEEVGQAYVSALTSATRARHGRHYTPSALAESLWEMAREDLGITGPAQALTGLVRDPACGAGALLLPALREHLHATADREPRLVLAQLPSLVEGIDLDPAGVWIANVILAAELLHLQAKIPPSRRRQLPALARVGDGLAPGGRQAKVMVLNPPYGRVHLSEADKARFADVLYGHANLYAVFMAAAEEQLDAQGVMAALVPTSWTAGRYFAPLRERLSTNVRLASVRFVEDRSGVFTGVLQETCLATFTRRRLRKTKVTSTSKGQARVIANVPTPRGQEPWLLPRRSNLAMVAAAAAGMPTTLGELGWKVSTGPLVWNRRQEDLRADAAEDCIPVLWSSDLDGGSIQRDARRNDKRFIQLSSGSDQTVLALREPALLVQRTAAPESPRKLVSALLDEARLDNLGGAVVVENHVNVLRSVDSRIPIELMSRIFATPTFDSAVRCISGSVALSAYELMAVPMPDEETILSWAELDDSELPRAVAAAYRPRGAR
ncbi:Eco57I restriction-modification methylase domain-containing protein [Luteococcus sediminum]